jgi:two-component system, NarL family, nitrate/nitrite response regulator NarL
MGSVNTMAAPATVLVAACSPHVREALAALIGCLEGFSVIGEAASDEQAIELARRAHPRLALIDEELPGCEHGWTIERLHTEGLVESVVAIGRRADGGLRARAAGACAYLQIGAAPADILSVVAAAVSA